MFIPINHPKTGKKIQVRTWIDRRLNIYLTHLIICVQYLHKNRIFDLTDISVRVFRADFSSFVEKHRHHIIGMRYWLYAASNIGNDIFIHKGLNKYESIAHIIHEICHIKFGNNERLVHSKAQELCMRIIQKYDNILFTFENKKIANSVTKADYEIALIYLHGTRHLF
tara:strand:+ start:284 stop:787 length:504 start_codon:yes stop_codon:yes gene_type:complete